MSGYLFQIHRGTQYRPLDHLEPTCDFSDGEMDDVDKREEEKRKRVEASLKRTRERSRKAVAEIVSSCSISSKLLAFTFLV